MGACLRQIVRVLAFRLNDAMFAFESNKCGVPLETLLLGLVLKISTYVGGIEQKKVLAVKSCLELKQKKYSMIHEKRCGRFLARFLLQV